MRARTLLSGGIFKKTVVIYFSVRAYCTLQNETLRHEIKSVLCEMEICTLQNGNLYFAK